MKEETKDILAEFEKELLAEELLEEQEGPAFEDPDVLETGPEPEVYVNYANDYGEALQEFAESGGELSREDSGLIVWMLIASILCLGIIGVMLYWLQAGG